MSTIDVEEWWFTLIASSCTIESPNTSQGHAELRIKQPQDSTLPRHHFGAEMELVDDKCEDSVTTPHRDDPPQDHGAEH